jgi:predicted nuclease of restriction endonuclease-like RecB superfamily
VLPSELLVARRYRDSIRPAYAELDEENLGFASRLIDTFTSLRGRRRRELDETITALEESSGRNYKYVRGLATLLERRCLFEVEAAFSPGEARDRLFRAAAATGIPTTLEDRRKILEAEAARLDLPVDRLEDSIYSDLDEELILREFQPLSPGDLIRLYNLGQTQTLLFKCSELEFTASGNWQLIFRWIKWLGLIYTIQQQGESYWVKVDGPVSLFKLGDRYGTSLAKLVPLIVAAPEWSIRSLILRRTGDRQLLRLELDSRRHDGYLRAEKPSEAEPYDSTVEQSFALRFNASRTGWSLTREPGPIPVGRQVMIPDFLLERAGMKVYMEVAGFWTPEYLRHKLEQLRRVDGVDMIVAADADHACQQLDSLGRKLDIIYYKDDVPLRPVLDHLRARESELKKDQLQRLQSGRLEVEGPAVSAAELAGRLGLLEEAVLEELRRREIPGYRLLGDILISESTLKLIAKSLEERMKEGLLTLREATELAERLGGAEPSRILEHLGYVIEWHGISPEKAEVHRRLVR